MTCSEIVWCPTIILSFIVSIITISSLTIISIRNAICWDICDINNLSSLSNSFFWLLPANTPDINFYIFPINSCFTSFRTERSPNTRCISFSFNVFNKVIDITTIAFSTSVVFIRSDMNSRYPMKWCIWTIKKFVIN